MATVQEERQILVHDHVSDTVNYSKLFPLFVQESGINVIFWFYICAMNNVYIYIYNTITLRNNNE